MDGRHNTSYERLRQESLLISANVGLLREELMQEDYNADFDPAAALIAEAIRTIEEIPVENVENLDLLDLNRERENGNLFEDILQSPNKFKRFLNRISELYSKLNYMALLADAEESAKESFRMVANQTINLKRGYVNTLRNGASGIRSLLAFLRKAIEVILADIMQMAQGIYSMRTLIEWSLSFGLAGALQTTLTFAQ